MVLLQNFYFIVPEGKSELSLRREETQYASLGLKPVLHTEKGCRSISDPARPS